jgi:hypothetical protein
MMMKLGILNLGVNKTGILHTLPGLLTPAGV